MFPPVASKNNVWPHPVRQLSIIPKGDRVVWSFDFGLRSSTESPLIMLGADNTITGVDL